jgi:UDP-N-acetylmuramoyl-L-alanyl-D-glutamate--2,6-diaminopimelate ligase
MSRFSATIQRNMLHELKSKIPVSWLDVYHKILAKTAALLYGYPSRELVVIGVTGTNGKTTVAYLIAKALEADGSKTGCTTTALFKVADREWLNDSKMTMLGRFRLQRILRQMVQASCRYAVIETSSQGIVQHRHENIAYDVGVFTNLTPEHIEAHGGFENYKKAKIKLFEHIAGLPPKMIDGQRIPRAAVLNKDDGYASDFAVPGLTTVVWYGVDQSADMQATDVKETGGGVSFQLVIPDLIRNPEIKSDGSPTSALNLLGDDEFLVKLQLMGKVNVYNALAALAVSKVCGQDLAAAARKISEVKAMPGRFERLDEGQPWTVVVDYAPEPESLAKAYETVRVLQTNRLIHVLGSCGGGRDAARRPVLGRMAGENADVVIVTNEDPYDDEPMSIIDQVAEGARERGKRDDVDLFRVLDREQAIGLAMRQAAPGDLVLLTGKGSEQRICVAGGRKIPWDEREAARRAIRQVVAERTQKA